MKKILIILLPFLIGLNLSARQFSLSDIPLSKSDFEIKKGFRNHPHAAQIFAMTNLKSEFKSRNNQLFLVVDAKLFVNPQKSWIKEEFLEKATKDEKSELMNHEKGHLIIALIQFKKFQQICLEYPFTKQQLKSQFDSLYKCNKSTGDSLNLAYDEETNHMLNKERQVVWITQLMENFNKVYCDESKIKFNYQIEIALSE
jgi:hypothetical protein